MRLLLLPLVSLVLIAAAPPQRAFVMAVPTEPALGLAAPTNAPRAPSRFQPAPTPNRDLEGPAGSRASTSTSLEPSLVRRHDTAGGDTSRGSTAAASINDRAKPGAALNLRMPFAPN